MKKFFALILSVVMVFSMSLTALAQNLTPEQRAVIEAFEIVTEESSVVVSEQRSLDISPLSSLTYRGFARRGSNLA